MPEKTSDAVGYFVIISIIFLILAVIFSIYGIYKVYSTPIVTREIVWFYVGITSAVISVTFAIYANILKK